MNDIAIDKEHLHYLEQLSEMYPTIGKASSEIINLQAILNLPKGTEHFVSDVHGEYEAFSHVLKNGSGAVRKKIDDVFGLAMNKADKAALATLIYYPREKMELIKQDEPDMDSWYKTTLYKLIEVCKTVSSKYTRSKVRKALPEEYAYVIEELITEKPEVLNKEAYYESIINTTVELGTAEEFIVVLSELIQRLAVDHLHVLGDIYDRGAGPHLIMDRLCRYHSLDIQWGNHDIIWMGAAAGNPACIATVVRNSIRYGNLDVVEEGYGINMLPLATFALKAYKDDPCTRFVFKVAPSGADNMESDLIKKMHKAIAIIRFKLEGQLIKKWPEYGMKERLLLEHIDYEQGTIDLEGRTYKLLDTSFPTIDPADPYRLTEGEEEVIQRLRSSFIHCEKLKNHVGLLLKRGSMYKVYNGNLLFHGCIPMEEDGSFAKVNIYGKEYSGKALFDILETYVRKAFFSDRLKATKGTLDIRVMDFRGNLLFEKKKNVTLPPNTSKIQFSAPFKNVLGGKKPNEVFVNARFTENGKEGKIVTNNYFFDRYKNIDFPKADIRITSVPARDGYDLTVSSDVFARGVFLSLDGIDNFFSDNYFDLLPGEPVTIHVTTSLDKDTFDKQLRSESLADTY